MKTALAAIAICLSIAACSPVAAPSPTAPATPAFPTPAPTTTSIGTLTLTDSACALERTSAPLAAGQVSITVINRTRGAIWADLGRITDGTTFEVLARDISLAAEAARTGKDVIPPPAYMVRFPPLVLNAGGSASVTPFLVPGTYGIICLRTYEESGQIRPYAVAGPLEVK